MAARPMAATPSRREGHRTIRARASTDPGTLEYGLLPPGEIDGGISNSTKPEYSNTYWSLQASNRRSQPPTGWARPAMPPPGRSCTTISWPPT